jgi:biopolymer transport protein ExbB
MLNTLHRLILGAILAVVIFAGLKTVRAQDAAPKPAAPVVAMHKSKSLLDLYSQGGWVMHAVALCSIGTVGVLAYCITRIRKSSMMPEQLVAGLKGALGAQDLTGAFGLCKATPCSLSHIVTETLTNAGTGSEVYTKADLEAAASETIFHEETRHMLWVNMLNAFAAVAPMVGLLGTVSGMIQSFEALKDGKAKASDFAGGIGEAMVGTAGGLMVAIPAMFAYFYYKNQLQARVSELSRTTSRLIGTFLTGSAPASGEG